MEVGWRNWVTSSNRSGRGTLGNFRALRDSLGQVPEFK